MAPGRAMPAASLALSLAAALAVPGCLASDGERVAAVPQRPGLSFDSNTTAEGTLEVELGAVAGPDRGRDAPVTLKWGAGRSTEIFAGWNPWRRVEGPGADERGTGDVVLGARHRVARADDGAWAAAVQGLVKLAAGSEASGMSNGEDDVYLAATANGGDGAWFWTTYYQLGLLGEESGGGRDVEHGLALVLGRGVRDGVAVLGELSGTRSHERHTLPVVATLAATLSRRPDVVWDAGVELGLNDDAPDARVFLGVTLNLGRTGRLRGR